MLVIYGIEISLYSDQSNFPQPRTLLKSYSVGFRHMKKMRAARFKPNRAVNGFHLFVSVFLLLKCNLIERIMYKFYFLVLVITL